MARRLHTPRRIITVLEGESLLNDAAALVAYRVAVAAVATPFVLGAAALDFGLAVVGGILVGLAVAAVFRFMYERLENPPVEVALRKARVRRHAGRT